MASHQFIVIIAFSVHNFVEFDTNPTKTNCRANSRVRQVCNLEFSMRMQIRVGELATYKLHDTVRMLQYEKALKSIRHITSRVFRFINIFLIVLFSVLDHTSIGIVFGCSADGCIFLPCFLFILFFLLLFFSAISNGIWVFHSTSIVMCFKCNQYRTTWHSIHSLYSIESRWNLFNKHYVINGISYFTNQAKICYIGADSKKNAKAWCRFYVSINIALSKRSKWNSNNQPSKFFLYFNICIVIFGWKSAKTDSILFECWTYVHISHHSVHQLESV